MIMSEELKTKKKQKKKTKDATQAKQKLIRDNKYETKNHANLSLKPVRRNQGHQGHFLLLSRLGELSSSAGISRA